MFVDLFTLLYADDTIVLAENEEMPKQKSNKALV